MILKEYEQRELYRIGFVFDRVPQSGSKVFNQENRGKHPGFFDLLSFLIV